MKKRCLMVLMAGILGACTLTGCQKAPEASAGQDVYHAKSSLESEVEQIAAGETGTNMAEAGKTEQGEKYDALIGTEQNGIRICAEIPVVPQTVPTLTLQERDDFDEEKLKELMESENGNVRDITAEYLAETERLFQEMNEEDKPIEWLSFGDDSLLVLSDGQKEVSFTRNTCACYEDEILKQGCDAIYKRAPEIDVISGNAAASAEFTFSSAEEILLEKLSVLDIAEIHIYKVLYYEMDETSFYELAFTPSYEKMGVASEFGSEQYGDVHPRGTAWITENGIAFLGLENYCGKICERFENNKILTFSQVTAILEKYLENHTLCGISQAKLTRAELVYYPTLEKSKLVLTPAWHIGIPLKEMMEALESGDEAWQKAVESGAAWNIYLDAVTGELIKVE